MTQERFDEIDRRLEVLEGALVEYRTQQETNTASITTLQTLTSEMLDIARLHQQALKLSQQREEEDRAEIRRLRTETRRIWEYLLGQLEDGNGKREPEDNP